ncbi:hypothetical protein TSUD_178180 [Trifolium subterraneum]|uniref:Transposase (putative) gypsy type domain-containing protein n=1 Tax=Trifolium subterraneum TaxID=3900 RepID=A0A2Z6MGH3_TRISU|nr:hypothetical protein TSUD_178180 [Trifolium subterraneum]
MAEEKAPASTSYVEEDEFAWVADEPKTTVSKFSLIGGDRMFRTVQRPPLDDWKACIPNTSRRICSKFQWGSFPMYQIAFEHMGYRLPFSDFEVAVFRDMHLTPSQLHPNSLAFIRAFEMTAVYLGFLPTIPLFFHAFHLQRSRPKGDAANKFGWVSLKQSVKLFEMRQPRMLLDEEGNPVLDGMGVPVTKKTFIDTRKLLASKNLAETEACFQEMSTIAVKLRKNKANKEKRQTAGLGSSSTTVPPPTPVVESAEHRLMIDVEETGGNADRARPSKVSRVNKLDTSATGRIPSSASRFVLSPAIGSPGLVKKSSVSVSDAEKAIMDDLGPETLKNELTNAMVSAFKLMEISSYLNGRECKYLAERDAAKAEAALSQQKMAQAKVNHVAYKEKYQLQVGLVIKLGEKEAEAARLTQENEELEGQVKDLTTEKETLEGKVKELENRPTSSTAAPDAEELVILSL